MDIFEFDGFTGDRMTGNPTTSRSSRSSGASTASASWNASVSRFFKIALSAHHDQIANDGNLLPAPVPLTLLTSRARGAPHIAHRLLGAQHGKKSDGEPCRAPGRKALDDLTVASASAIRPTPCVGSPRVPYRAQPATPDAVRFAVMIPNPDLRRFSRAPRTFVRRRGPGHQRSGDDLLRPWGIKIDNATCPRGLRPRFGRAAVRHPEI
jgi:hypothetical protein